MSANVEELWRRIVLYARLGLLERNTLIRPQNRFHVLETLVLIFSVYHFRVLFSSFSFFWQSSNAYTRNRAMTGMSHERCLFRWVSELMYTPTI